MGAERAVAGRFRLEPENGHGSLAGPLAEVVRARDLESGRAVALKRFLPQYSSDPRFAVRFREHLKDIAPLRHPALVGIVDYGRDGDLFYIASEWVEGVHLGTYLAEYGAFSPPAAVYVARQICAALSGIHRQGMVHRGLKPENIFLTTGGEVKVADMGLSVLASDSGLSRTTVMMDMVNTMSPEQARGRPTEPASDIYSLGVILFTMVAGRPPFEAGDAWSVVRMHVQDSPPSLRARHVDAPQALAAIVEKALQKRPEARFATVEEMDAALAKLPESDDLLWLVSPQHLRGEQAPGLRARLGRMLNGLGTLNGETSLEQDRPDILRRRSPRLSQSEGLTAVAQRLLQRLLPLDRGRQKPALALLLLLQFVVVFAVAFPFFYLLSGVVMGAGERAAAGDGQRRPGIEEPVSAEIYKVAPGGVATPTLVPTAVSVEQPPAPTPTVTPEPVDEGLTTGDPPAGGPPPGAGRPPDAGPPPHAGGPPPWAGPPSDAGPSGERGRGGP